MRWDGSGAPPMELSVLSTGSNGFTNTNAYAINNAGVSAGFITRFDSGGVNKGTRAARWDAAGNVTELGGINADASGVTTGAAFAISQFGTAVGRAAKYTAAGAGLGSRAMRWDAAGRATELGTINGR